MKHKILALVLALTAMSWAQSVIPTEPSAPQKSAAKCACCDKMASADSKDGGMSCSRHSASSKDGKEAASCCGGKEAMSCCSGKDSKSCMKEAKNAASCCKDGCCKDKKASASCCDKDCKEGCCSKKTQSAMNCCDRHSHS